MGLFSAGKRKPGWMVIRIQERQIDVAYMDPSSTKPRALVCGSYRKDTDDVEILSRLRRELHLDRYRCINLLNYDQYQLLQIDAPNVPANELKTAARWRIKDLIDYPIYNATVDIIEIPNEKNSQAPKRSLYAVAAHNELLTKNINLFNSAKIPVEVIDIPEMGQRNIAKLFEPADRGVALLTFGENDGLLTFTAGGELFMARRIDIRISEVVDAQEEQQQSLYERIVLELQRSFDHFDRQYQYVTVAKLLISPLPSSLKLIPYLAENLYVPVETLELDKVIDIEAISQLQDPEKQVQNLQILGAALRNGVAK